MKLKQIAAASLVALGASSAFAAANVSEDSFIDEGSFVFTFAASAIPSNQTLFTFSLDTNDFFFDDYFMSPMDYFVTGGISGAKYSITSVTLDGTPWMPTTGSDIDLGIKNVGPGSELIIKVTGNKAGAGANFNGQLVLTPVPEPETYALMLAGLGVVGFVAARRRQRA
jgi:PEP-CTERM motif